MSRSLLALLPLIVRLSLFAGSLTCTSQTVQAGQVKPLAAQGPISEAHELYCFQCRAQCNLSAKRASTSSPANIQQQQPSGKRATNLSAVASSVLDEQRQIHELRCACNTNLGAALSSEARATARLARNPDSAHLVAKARAFAGNTHTLGAS